MNQQNQNLPPGWVWVKLGECYSSISLNGLKIKQKDYLPFGKYPVIDQGKELIGGYYDDETLLVPGEPPFIVFGDHTKVKKFVSFKFIAGGDGVKVLKPHIFFNPKLFFYFLHCLKLPDKGYARHFQFLKKTQIPLPPLAEQHRIVAKIEELLSSLDKATERLQTAQEQLKRYRQAVLKWAFEGRFTHKNLKAGELPQGWVWKKLGEVALINPRLPFENISDDLEVSFIPMKYVEELVNKVNLIEIKKYGEVKKGYTPITDGDVIFAKITPCMENGKIAVVHSLRNKIGFGSTEFHVLRCSINLLNKFLFYLLIQEKVRQQAAQSMTGAVGQRRVPKQFLETLEIPLPPLAEQEQIVSEIEKRLSVAEKVEESIRIALEKAERLRQSILKKAFEGKLVPQDPNDEPASILLERIKAEQQKITKSSYKSNKSVRQ